MKWNSKSVEKVFKKYPKSVQKVLKMQNVFLAEIPFSCRHGICKVLPKDMRPFSDRRHCQTKVPDTFADLGPRSGQLVSEVWRFGPKVWALLPSKVCDVTFASRSKVAWPDVGDFQALVDFNAKSELRTMRHITKPTN